MIRQSNYEESLKAGFWIFTLDHPLKKSKCLKNFVIRFFDDILTFAYFEKIGYK